jgi:SAM-dependent methyltransferase
MGTPTESFQIPLAAAEVYEARFVPAIFAEWAPRLLDLAGVGPGQRVLDVACGTGVVARTAAPLVAPDGQVTAVDLNEAMLTVARRSAGDAEVEWRQGDAGELPFDDGSVDVAVCQMALMFFPDRVRALREMRRVVRPGGKVAVCVPAALADQPAYRLLVEVAERHAGPAALALLGAYWSCGDLGELRGWFGAAGLVVADTVTHAGVARFADADDMVATEVEGSPLIDRITDDVYAAIRTEARTVLAPFTTPAGTMEAPLVAHVVSANCL